MQKRSIWIDFENAPHVWVLSPIVEYLRGKGYSLILTARDFSSTLGLCRWLGFDVRILGSAGGGKHAITKAEKILHRSCQLYFSLFGTRNNIGLALSHGSRTQALAARCLGIPVVGMDDYEFSNQSFVRFMDNLLVPFPIPRDIWGRRSDRIVHYPSLKEELYLCKFKPCQQESTPEFGDPQQIKVLFRPEGRFAHYHSPQTGILQDAILQYLAHRRDILLVLLPRDELQAKVVTDYCEKLRISCRVPDGVLDGPNLIWQMDLVIGGGGTMTREAAVLGIPAYSFFSGRWGAVDIHLQKLGRLVRIVDKRDVSQIILKKHTPESVSVPDTGLKHVIDFVEQIVDK